MIKYVLVALIAFSAVPAEARPYHPHVKWNHPHAKWKHPYLTLKNKNKGKSEAQILQDIKRREATEDHINKNIQKASEALRQQQCAALKLSGGQC